MQRRSFNWVVALVGIGLAGVVAVSGATALAARSEPSAFELTVEGRWEWNKDDPAYGLPAVLVGTFTSGAPFCGSGTAADVEPPRQTLGGSHRYTCSDGSGSLTLAMTNREAVYGGGIGRGEWTIVEGSGRYASLRGKGTYNGEMLDWTPRTLSRPRFGRHCRGSSMLRTPSRRRSPSRRAGPQSSVVRRAPTRSRSRWHSATTSRGTPSRTC